MASSALLGNQLPVGRRRQPVLRRVGVRSATTTGCSKKWLTAACLGVAAVLTWSRCHCSKSATWLQVSPSRPSRLAAGSNYIRFLNGEEPTSRLALKATGFDPLAEAVDPRIEEAKRRAQEEMKTKTDTDGLLRVRALGGGKGSFLLEMGGLKLLVNPKLDASSPIQPEKVHEEVDYVVITSAKEEFLDVATIERMKLMKVNFIACGNAGEVLERMLVRNLATLYNGPGGRCLLTGEKGKAPVGVLLTPGANAPLPWQTPESGFLFVNMKTGYCVAYEATGQFLGPDARSEVEGIPEEAYQLDYLITPDLEEAAGVSRGLTIKGAQIKGIVKLPDPADAGHAAGSGSEVADASNPLVDAYISAEKKVDSMISGGVDTETKSEKEFRDFLGTMGKPLADARLITPTAGGEAITLEAGR